MAVVDVSTRSVTLKIVYYGCAMGGKTTNLITLHRLTDPSNDQGLVSIATKDDRTLFFDLLPMDLGQIGGLSVKVKLYTVPGQVHYETTRRQVLSGADGVVLVADSNPSPEIARSNNWAWENLLLNLTANGLDPETIPIVLQWNKRDLPDARPVVELNEELNPRGLEAIEAIAVRGPGVVQTFAAVLKQSVIATYRKTQSKATPESIAKRVDEALADAAVELPAGSSGGTEATVFDHRFDMDGYRDEQADQGRDRRIVDQESLLSEAVSTNMKLAEKLDDYRDVHRLSDRRSQMMQALGLITPKLADPEAAALPEGVMALLLKGAGRSHGSILLTDIQNKTMQEREVVPPGPDPLNSSQVEGLGSVAFNVARNKDMKVIDDLQGEVFFDTPCAAAKGLAGVLLAPLACDHLAFGALAIYSKVNEPMFDDAEKEYWGTASVLMGLSLHWRALRRKLTQQQAG